MTEIACELRQMTRSDFYNISRTAGKVRRLLLKTLGVEQAHAGLCGIAALPLCAEIRKSGYEAIVVFGHVKVDRPKSHRSHYWVETNGFVVDITGDQFNHFISGQKLPGVIMAPYNLLPRYKADRKDAIPLTGIPEGLLEEWLGTLR